MRMLRLTDREIIVSGIITAIVFISVIGLAIRGIICLVSHP